jgi:hypothetical protein
MHLNRLGKANRLTRQTLDPRSQPQVLALNLLGVTFTWLMLICIEMTGVSAIIVRIITLDAKRLK